MKLRCKTDQIGKTYYEAAKEKRFIEWVRSKRRDLIKELRMFLAYVDRNEDY